MILGTVASTNFTIGAGDPNGTQSGTNRDKFFDKTANILYICTAGGDSQTAQWTAIEAAIDTYEEF